jgi:hypothetical protein
MAEAVSGGTQNREDLVERLFGAFAVQVREIESRVAAHEGDAILEDAKILAGLAKTMEILVSLDKKVSPEEGGSLDLESVRAELSERLKRLTARGSANSKRGGSHDGAGSA